MNTNESESHSITTIMQKRRMEVIIAMIGLLGVLVTAFLSNWDKIFPEADTVEATYTGYAPTGDIEIEIQYFFSITGYRAQMKQILSKLKNAFTVEGKWHEDQDLNDLYQRAFEEELERSLDELMRRVVPVLSKYYTLEQIQELNKFYSTSIMRKLVEIKDVINEAVYPLGYEIGQNFGERLKVRFNQLEEKFDN